MADYYSKPLAEFAATTEYSDLPLTLVSQLKMLLLDSLGCGLAGLTTDPGKMACSLAQRLGGTPESSVLGTGSKVSSINAGWANGQLINTIDYDALVAPGAHSPPYIIAPALAVAESLASSGKDLITAMAVGFEVCGRVSGALSRGSAFVGPDLNELQWAPRWGHASCNFGTAAGTGRILGLNPDKMLHALGTAGHLCQVQTWIRYTMADNRSMAKYGVPGWQNTGGMTAALLAEMGYLGDTSVLDDEEGFWKFVGYDYWKPENITKDLGKEWVCKIGYKNYPCCRMFQTELDCFLKLVKENNLTPDDIDSVLILGHPTLDANCFTNREIKSIADVQFGPAYIFAMAVHGVPKGVDWQDLEMVRSPRIQRFADRVTFRGSPDFGKTQISAVEVTAKGTTLREAKPFGDVHKPTDEELMAKYRHNASKILTEQQIEHSIDYILNLEKLENIRDLMSQLTL